MTEYEEKLNIAQTFLTSPIDPDIFMDILFEMSKYFDKKFITQLHSDSLTINQNERNLLRKYYYYGIKDWLSLLKIDKFPRYSALKEDKINVLNTFIDKCRKESDRKKIIGSLNRRYDLIRQKSIPDNSDTWLKWFNEKRKKNSDFSLFIYDYNQDDFIGDNFDISAIFGTISDMYNHLENYRHFIFNLRGKLFNEQNQDVTWKVLYKIGIYCENFNEYTGKYAPFKKDRQIKKLLNFLNARFEDSRNNAAIADDFYSSVSTGFKFEDCLISEDQENIILSMKKIVLDETEIPCPACLSTIQNGNSYPDFFLRSYECKNPHCPERSKSGRGKRFDEFGSYRYFKLVENKQENHIKDELYKKWRKDIFSSNNGIYEMLINYYAWDNENICVTKKNLIQRANGRNIVNYKRYNDSSYNTDFMKIKIVKLFSKLSKSIVLKTGCAELKSKIEVKNNNSTEELSSLAPNQIGTVITSPPYYNAREYSSWNNMIFYLIDMQRNAAAVHDVLCENGYYLYNIGDIVNFDNVYVESNMSKRRLPLGFLSCLIFELAGFQLAGNIIWDKGEVQSKRNSAMNRNSGYIHCINCYEHVLVFKKGYADKSVSTVRQITPVIKINSKGENTYKHTAPYPEELVELIRPFIMNDKYILDPFLGSGTTLKWCKRNNLKGIGYEMNAEYFELAKHRIFE